MTEKLIIVSVGYVIRSNMEDAGPKRGGALSR
jgi:hypothetical protein